MASRREFLSFALGSAAVVGFETTFGLSGWRGFEPSSPKYEFNGLPVTFPFGDPFEIDMRPGAINRVRPGQILHILPGGAFVIADG